MQRTAVRTLVAVATILTLAAVLGAAAILSACAARAPEARAVLSRSATPPPLKVYARDINLPSHYKLENSAILAVQDGRVTVALRGVQSTEEAADPDRWTVTIVDDNGLVFSPTARLDSSYARLAVEWDEDQPPLPCTPTSVRALYRRFPALDVYQGTARYEFDYPGLSSAQTLTVVVVRADNELRFSWRFADGTGTATSVADYGRTPAEEQCPPLIVPGKISRVAEKM